MATMNQKSSLQKTTQSVSQVLMSDTGRPQAPPTQRHRGAI